MYIGGLEEDWKTWVINLIYDINKAKKQNKSSLLQIKENFEILDKSNQKTISEFNSKTDDLTNQIKELYSKISKVEKLASSKSKNKQNTTKLQFIFT